MAGRGRPARLGRRQIGGPRERSGSTSWSAGLALATTLGGARCVASAPPAARSVGPTLWRRPAGTLGAAPAPPAPWSVGLALALVAALAALAGCAAPSRPPLPTELPFQTADQLFQLRWALERGPAVVRATGLAGSHADKEFHLTIGLFGVDAGGAIVSRGVTWVQSRFSREPVPFTVGLVPTGREARFELRVLESFVTGFRR